MFSVKRVHCNQNHVFYLRSKLPAQTDIFATRTCTLTYISPEFSENKGQLKISNIPFERGICEVLFLLKKFFTNIYVVLKEKLRATN